MRLLMYETLRYVLEVNACSPSRCGSLETSLSNSPIEGESEGTSRQSSQLYESKVQIYGWKEGLNSTRI